LYDEGFKVDRAAGYACEEELAIPGAERALRDIDAATTAILAMPFVDRSKLVVMGQSRGGVLSVAWSGQRPTLPSALINFVGGWLGTGCPTATSINQGLLKRGVGYPKPSLWLYGERDPFYPLEHSRANFEAFLAAGGKATFHEFPPPSDGNGHRIGADPALWGAVVEAYLVQQGLPIQRP
jgi:dienelactone hydrolase